MTAAPGTAVIELASSGLADNPALHAAVVAPLVVIGLAWYLIRRRRKVDRDPRVDHDPSGSGPGGPTDPERRP